MKTTTDISDVTVSSKDDSKGTIANFLLSAVMLLICIFCCKAGVETSVNASSPPFSRVLDLRAVIMPRVD